MYVAIGDPQSNLGELPWSVRTHLVGGLNEETSEHVWQLMTCRLSVFYITHFPRAVLMFSGLLLSLTQHICIMPAVTLLDWRAELDLKLLQTSFSKQLRQTCSTSVHISHASGQLTPWWVAVWLLTKECGLECLMLLKVMFQCCRLCPAFDGVAAVRELGVCYCALMVFICRGGRGRCFAEDGRTREGESGQCNPHLR